MNMLRKVLRPERELLMAGWRKSHSGQHHDLHLSPDVNWVIRSLQMRCSGQVAHVGGEEKCIQNFGGETGRIRDNFADLS
jgi:hypothetical protein